MEGSTNALQSASAQIQDFEYLNASNTNVSNFISVKLSGSHNYLLWKAQMLCLLDSNNMCGIVDATFVVPRNYGSETTRQYDSLVKGWIFGSVSEDVLVDVFGLSPAKAVWEKLNSIYEPTTYLQEDPAPKSSDEKTEIEEGANLKEIIVPAETETINEDTRKKGNRKRHITYVHECLRRYTVKGDWSEVERMLIQDEDTVVHAVSSDGSTMLHIAVGIGRNDFVKKLFSYINGEQVLNQRDSDGSTALHIAAIVGNKDAAELLVKKNNKLLGIKDQNDKEPLHKAYENMHLDTIAYLLKAVNDYGETERHQDTIGYPGDEIAVGLLVNAISAKQYSLALEFIKNFRKAASTSDDVLMAIAKTFPTTPNYWETLVYPPSPDSTLEFIEDGPSNLRKLYRDSKNKLCKIQNKEDVVEVAIRLLLIPVVLVGVLIFSVWLVFIMFYSLWWKGVKIVVPPIKHIDNKMKEWDEAKNVLTLVCVAIDLDYPCTPHPCYTRPILEAACQNAYEVVDEILFRSPEVIESTDKDGYDIIQLAIINRSEKIYNLIYDIGERKNVYRTYTDSSENNILHLAGKLALPGILNQRTGAALQLQRELQWREEVKKFVFPTYITRENIFKETPDMVFTREHKDLVKEGEQWIKTTAESCSITAALITTIVFAAATTVPGGSNQENGTPLFRRKIPFIIFAVSDAISLFASSTALLVFLSILTARFAEKDFLVSLPRRLFIGLFTLILSTTAMMVAFSATVFLVFCDEKQWMLGPICGLAFIPIASFVSLQFPLMVDLYCSTYIRIFGKQRRTTVRRFNSDEIRLRFGTNIDGEKRNDNQDKQFVRRLTKRSSRQ